jgi:hypothetical protein
MKAAMAIGLFFPAFLWTPVAMADCKCIANGRAFHHGEIACIRLPSGPQLAQCGMVLNNSSWIKLQDGCPLAQRGGPIADAICAALYPHPQPLPTRGRETPAPLSRLKS